jgi:type I restriction enzyme S subunit
VTKNKKDKWLSLTISELGKVITGKTPSSKNPEFFGDIYPFITPTDMEFDHIRIKTERFLSEQGRIKQSNLLLPKNSICFTCIGATIGKICMTKSESFTNQQINSLVVDHKKNSPYFIYSLLRTLRYEIISIAGGSAIPIVNKTAFSKISISVPPLPTQQKIAGILSAYDDLIENNTRRIEILEEMARMLYREWFVKFRFPCHEAVQFVESELGLIPEGWEVKKLKEFIEIKHGYAFKGEFFSKDPTPNILLTPGNFKFGGGFKWDKLKYYDGEMPSDFILKNGDLIVTMTDLSKLGDTLGYPALVPPSKDLKFLHNQRIGKVNFKNQKLGLFYLYYLLCSDSYRGHVLGTATGSTVKHTAPDRIKDFSFIFPESDILNQFEKIADSIIHQTVNLESKNINLRKTRDLLLPRLISGEIDVENLAINTGIQP